MAFGQSGAGSIRHLHRHFLSLVQKTPASSRATSYLIPRALDKIGAEKETVESSAVRHER